MPSRHIHCLKHGTNKWKVPVRKYALPEDFLFGAATSAFQIEGGTDAQTGRGASIWDTFLTKHNHQDTGAVACDHYNRMPADVELMKQLGLQAYRFSVAWPW